MPLSMRASPIWSLDYETDEKPIIIIIIIFINASMNAPHVRRAITHNYRGNGVKIYN